MKVVLAGEGAIATKHAEALSRIEDVQVVGVVGGDPDATARFAQAHGIARWSLELDDGLDDPEVDAVVLATPTPLHSAQALRCLQADKHVLVEIPVADSLAGAEAVADAAERSGRIAMVCHTRRFSPSHQFVHQHIQAGTFTVQHLLATTVFFRRENLNARGEPRSWTDDLLWHHACHTVDLFIHQTGQVPDRVRALAGPPHPELAIAMDLSLGLANDDGALCSIALSFNHDGPQGTTFRYIGDRGTYVAFYDELTDGYGEPVDLSGVGTASDGVEGQDRAFLDAIRSGRTPLTSIASILPVMETLDRLERSLPG